jgi:hypothetical protein
VARESEVADKALAKEFESWWKHYDLVGAGRAMRLVMENDCLSDADWPL